MTLPVSFLQRRLKWALVTSVFAKVSAVALHLFSIPIATKSLGVGGYAAFVALFAVGTAPQIFILRYGPSLTGHTARCFGRSQWHAISQRFYSALFVSFGLLLIVVAATIALWQLGLYGPPFISSQFSSESGLVLGIIIANGLLGALLTTVEDTQAGFQESHIHSVRFALGNAAALAAICSIVPYRPNLLTYTLALLVPPLLLRVLNAGVVLLRYPKLRPGIDAVAANNIGMALREGALYSLVVGLGAYASNQIPIVVTASTLGAEDTATVSTISRLCLSAFAFGSVFSISFVPAFSTGLGLGNHEWVRLWLNRIEVAFAAMLITFVLLFWFLGRDVYQRLMHVELPSNSSCLLFAGAYAGVLVMEHFYLLVALSVNSSPVLTALFLLRTSLTALASVIACKLDYIPGIWLGGAVAVLFVTLIPFRLVVFGHLTPTGGSKVLET